MKPRSKIIVFDVNETLLDIEILNPFFASAYGDARVMRQWFAELILYSQALTLSGSYLEFGKLAVGVLQMVAEIRGVSLSDADVADFTARMRSMPAHPDAAPALALLQREGFRLATLTNSGAKAGKAVLEKAGLAGHFERLFSVEEAGQFKPAPATYEFVATSFGVETGSLRMVAAHTWDTLGAVAAGCDAALLTRPGNALLPVGPQPGIVEKDLVSLARRIVETDS